MWVSVLVSKTSGRDEKKDGQPEPLSYFIVELKSFTPQPAQ
jgi:hypothetical protein